GRALDPLWEADEGSDALDLCRDRVEPLPGSVEKITAQQKVLRRVARDAELGQHNQLGTALASLLDRLRDQADVALDVAHGRVDLGECQAQVCCLSHGPKVWRRG